MLRFALALLVALLAASPRSNAKAQPSLLHLDRSVLSLELPDHAHPKYWLTGASALSMRGGELEEYRVSVDLPDSRRPTGRKGLVTATLLAGAGTGIAASGLIHVALADARAESCAGYRDEVQHEHRQRRVGWALTGFGSAMALSMLSTWFAFRIGRGVARWRAAPGAYLGALGVTTLVSTGLIWLGMIGTSRVCYGHSAS